MIDITPQIRAFIASKATWSAQRSLTVAKKFAQVLGARVDWDEEAGENWIRIITDTQVMAFISVLGPLAVLAQDVAGKVQADQIEVVVTPNIGNATLTADLEVLVEAFGERVRRSLAFDPGCFSAEELWFVSV